MDTILFKYHCHGDDYLVYDTCKNNIELDARAVRAICTRNFGLGSVGVLVGPLMDGEQMSMKFYRPDGSEMSSDLPGAQIFGKYLRDAGYLKRNACTLHSDEGDISLGEETFGERVEEIGKLFLSETFLSRN